MAAAPIIVEEKALPSRAEGKRLAAREYNAKLKLEVSIIKELQPFHSSIVRAYKRKVNATGRAFNIHRAFGSRLEKILLDHYLLVAKVFMRSVRKLAGIWNEDDSLPDFLIAHFEGRAKLQAKRINATTQKKAEWALFKAKERRQVLKRQGMSVNIATLAGGMLESNLRGREEGIAILETQAPAEGSKLTQVEMLYGEEPTLANTEFKARSIRKLKKVKMWNSLGDSRVRDHHLKADSKIVDFKQPFIVMGEHLMYPGDTSMGATMKNVARCRCSVSYDYTVSLSVARGVGGMGAPGKKPLKKIRHRDKGPGPSDYAGSSTVKKRTAKRQESEAERSERAFKERMDSAMKLLERRTKNA